MSKQGQNIFYQYWRNQNLASVWRRTRPDTRLSKSRADGQGSDIRQTKNYHRICYSSQMNNEFKKWNLMKIFVLMFSIKLSTYIFCINQLAYASFNLKSFIFQLKNMWKALPWPIENFRFAWKMKISTKQELSAIPRSFTERAVFLFCWFFDLLCRFKIFREQLLKRLLSIFSRLLRDSTPCYVGPSVGRSIIRLKI